MYRNVVDNEMKIYAQPSQSKCPSNTALSIWGCIMQWCHSSICVCLSIL